MPFRFTSYLALIFFYSLSAVDFVSYFVEKVNTCDKESKQAHSAMYSTSFLFPGKAVSFQLELIVVKFLGLSNRRGRTFAKFVLEDKHQSENKGEDNWP